MATTKINVLTTAKQSVLATLSNFKLDESDGGLIKSIIGGILIALNNFLNYTHVEPVLLKAIAGAMIANIFSGIYKAKRLGTGYNGKKLKEGLFEKIVYLVVFFAFAFFVRAFGLEYKWLIITIFGVLGWSEINSCWTNIQSARTKKEVEEVDVIVLLSKIIRSFVKGLIDGLITKIKTINKKDKE